MEVTSFELLAWSPPELKRIDADGTGGGVRILHRHRRGNVQADCSGPATVDAAVESTSKPRQRWPEKTRYPAPPGDYMTTDEVAAYVEVSQCDPAYGAD